MSEFCPLSEDVRDYIRAIRKEQQELTERILKNYNDYWNELLGNKDDR